VTAVERWLGANARYSLDSPVPAPGRDAVDAFLFDDHVGFCEQFASAEAVLLRAVGIPSRLVTGLAYGAPAASPRLRTFRASDAHAWVEVWYPALGWQPSDPTAHAALAKQGASADGRIRAMLRRLVGDSRSRRVVFAVLLVVIAIAVAALALTSRRRRERPAGERTDWRPSTGPVAMAFGVFSNRWRATLPRAPSETAREYVARVAMTDPLDDALVTLEEECYGAQVPDTRRVVAAVDAFEGSRPPVTDVGPQPR